MPPLMLLTSAKPRRSTRKSATLRDRTPWWHSTTVGALGSSSSAIEPALAATEARQGRMRRLRSPPAHAESCAPALHARQRVQLEAGQRRRFVLPGLAHVDALHAHVARRQQLRQRRDGQLFHAARGRRGGCVCRCRAATGQRGAHTLRTAVTASAPWHACARHATGGRAAGKARRGVSAALARAAWRSSRRGATARTSTVCALASACMAWHAAQRRKRVPRCCRRRRRTSAGQATWRGAQVCVRFVPPTAHLVSLPPFFTPARAPCCAAAAGVMSQQRNLLSFFAKRPAAAPAQAEDAPPAKRHAAAGETEDDRPACARPAVARDSASLDCDAPPRVVAPPLACGSPAEAPSTATLHSDARRAKALKVLGGGLAPKASAVEAKIEARFSFLADDAVRDAHRRPPSHADYDSRTVYIPPSLKLSPSQQAYWDIKKNYGAEACALRCLFSCL